MDLQPLVSTDMGLLAPLQPDYWGDIAPAFAYYATHPNCFPHKLILNDEIAGVGTIIKHANTAWLAHIIVHKNYRGRGWGTFITKELLNSGTLNNIKTIQLIATELGEPVYAKLGFRTETEYILAKDIPVPAASTVLPPIRACTQHDRPQLLQVDEQITGEERTVLLEQHFNNGFVYPNGNKVEGFYLPTLGEGWIAATSAAAGTALMQLRFTQKQNAAFPVNNLTAADFLAQRNIPEYKRVKRMILGDARKWQPENVYNRIAGNLG